MIKAGQRLKEERLKQALTLEEISQSTKIKIAFLEAIEKGEYDKLPSSTFAQGFVRNYTIFLGLPEKEVLPLFRREFDEERIYKVLPEGVAKTDFPVSRIKKSQFILISFLFLGLFLYLFFQYKDAIVNPSIEISSPKENEVLSSTLVLVAGSTNPENVVYVNNFPISVDENGKFKKSISLFSGKAQIKIRVVNRFNKVSEKTLNITVAVP